MIPRAHGRHLRCSNFRLFPWRQGMLPLSHTLGRCGSHTENHAEENVPSIHINSISIFFSSSPIPPRKTHNYLYTVNHVPSGILRSYFSNGKYMKHHETSPFIDLLTKHMQTWCGSIAMLMALNYSTQALPRLFGTQLLWYNPNLLPYRKTCASLTGTGRSKA